MLLFLSLLYPLVLLPRNIGRFAATEPDRKSNFPIPDGRHRRVIVESEMTTLVRFSPDCSTTQQRIDARTTTLRDQLPDHALGWPSLGKISAATGLSQPRRQTNLLHHHPHFPPTHLRRDGQRRNLHSTLDDGGCLCVVWRLWRLSLCVRHCASTPPCSILPIARRPPRESLLAARCSLLADCRHSFPFGSSSSRLC